MNETDIAIVPPSDVDRMQPTSEISSPGDSDQEIEKPLSPTSSSPWKRKRSNFEQESASDRDSPKEPSAKATKLYMNTSAGALVEDQYPGGSVGEDDQAVEVDSALLPVTEVEPKNSLELVQPVHKYQKGKRKGRKIDDGGLDTVNIEDSIARSPAEHADNQDLMSSEEEEDENDEEGDAPDADNALKTEEGGK